MKDVLIEMQQERAFLCRGAEGREGSEVALCATSSSEKLPLLNFRRRRAVEAAAEAVEAVEAVEDGRGRRTTMVARRRFFSLIQRLNRLRSRDVQTWMGQQRAGVEKHQV